MASTTSEVSLIRFRFKTNSFDYRPVIWPVVHPYWSTGRDAGAKHISTMIAYTENEANLKRMWPEAFDIEAETVSHYTFSDRFPKPRWWQPTGFPEEGVQ